MNKIVKIGLTTVGTVVVVGFVAAAWLWVSFPSLKNLEIDGEFDFD